MWCINLLVKIATYISEIKRSLKTRINEHKKNNNIESVIHTHRNSLYHEFNWNDTKIIDIKRDYKKDSYRK